MQLQQQAWETRTETGLINYVNRQLHAPLFATHDCLGNPVKLPRRDCANLIHNLENARVGVFSSPCL
jgi:hypothetical protein